MKRDMDLTRSLTLRLEEQDDWMLASSLSSSFNLPNHTDRQVDEHLLMMLEAGLIEGKRQGVAEGSAAWGGLRLTWNGHEFIAAARDDRVWKQATGKIAKSVGTTTMEVLTRLLSDIAARAVGLP